MTLLARLQARANDRCELCGSDSDLTAFHVPPHEDQNDDHAALVCGVCAPQLDPSAELDAKHWFCLQESIWSEVPAIQVLSWRTATRLSGEGWAADLLGQAYLADEVLAWAKEGQADPNREPTRDSNGAELNSGDSVTLIKDLDVKGANFTAKRGTMVRNIRVTDDPGLIEGKVNGTQIVLKTEFLKRAT